MSDVYAMGGEVTMGINIVGFPDNLPHSILSQILQGGADKMAEVGAIVAGGHTVTDKEPKYGICVTGTIHPEQIFTKGGALPGDALFLTKPLGTGVITTAHKRDAVSDEHLKAATDSMSKLNRKAAAILRRFGKKHVHACTDITGFGLLGHSSEMASQSQAVDLFIDIESLPLLPGALELARQGYLPGGMGRNRVYLQKEDEPKVRVLKQVSLELEDIAFDPETSGGLFFAFPAELSGELESAFAEEGEPLWRVGEARPGSGMVVIN
jgi:selenide,water dikinase